MSEKYIWEGETIHIQEVVSKVNALERWQKQQNGSIQRIEEKVDRLMYLHYSELAAVIGCSVGIILYLCRKLGL